VNKLVIVFFCSLFSLAVEKSNPPDLGNSVGASFIGVEVDGTGLRGR
jgi:hypothetical protein